MSSYEGTIWNLEESEISEALGINLNHWFNKKLLGCVREFCNDSNLWFSLSEGEVFLENYTEVMPHEDTSKDLSIVNKESLAVCVEDLIDSERCSDIKPLTDIREEFVKCLSLIDKAIKEEGES